MRSSHPCTNRAASPYLALSGHQFRRILFRLGSCPSSTNILQTELEWLVIRRQDAKQPVPLTQPDQREELRWQRATNQCFIQIQKFYMAILRTDEPSCRTDTFDLTQESQIPEFGRDTSSHGLIREVQRFFTTETSLAHLKEAELFGLAHLG